MPIAPDLAEREPVAGQRDHHGPGRRPTEGALPSGEDPPRGEQDAWRAYRAELHRFVRARVDDESAAEDLVHDVLLRAYSHRDTLRDARQLRSWLYRITRNALIDYYRKRRPMSTLPHELVDEVPPEDNDAQRELARCIEPLVDALPPRYREALILSELEGVLQREVAERLGLSISGAKSRVQRARKMLAAMLLDCCRVELDSRGGIMDYEPRCQCERC